MACEHLKRQGFEVFLPLIQWDIDKVKADFPKIELKAVKDFIL